MMLFKIICRLFNHKLYTQYYPLVTEEDKNDFLNFNYTEIYKMIKYISDKNNIELLKKRESYHSRTKSAVSFLGTLNYRNIIHNEYIFQKMLMDMDIIHKEENIQKLDLLMCKLDHHEYKNITIDELNWILKYMNTEKNKTLIAFLLLPVLLIICICMFLCP